MKEGVWGDTSHLVLKNTLKFPVFRRTSPAGPGTEFSNLHVRVKSPLDCIRQTETTKAKNVEKGSSCKTPPKKPVVKIEGVGDR